MFPLEPSTILNPKFQGKIKRYFQNYRIFFFEFVSEQKL